VKKCLLSSARVETKSLFLLSEKNVGGVETLKNCNADGGFN